MRILSILGAVLLTMATLAPARAQKAGDIRWKDTVFTSEPGETTEAEVGALWVPENRARPTGKLIKLPLLRFRTTARTPSAPIVYLAGGPGASGISGVRRDLYPYITAMRDVADVITFDQRGTGGAEPSLAVPGRLAVPAGESVVSPRTREAIAEQARQIVADLRGRGIDLSAYNTVESADDVEAIRRAIGASKLTLWGHSYGSHLALAVLKRHGARVERAILGGVNGLDQRWRYPSDGQALLVRIDSALKAHPKLRVLMPDFLGTTARVLERLAASPQRVPVAGGDVHLGKEELQVTIAIQSGEIDFIRGLPLGIALLDSGQYTNAAGLVRAVLTARPVGTAMTYVMHLASGVSPDRAARIAEEVPRSLLGDAINFPWSDSLFRAAWNVPDLGARYRAPVRSSVPTLFISGTFDGRTSIGDAEEVRKGFRRSQHLVIDGVSHNFYGASPEILAAMIRFLRGMPLTSAHITVPLEFRGPDEPTLVAELRRLAVSGGADSAVARLRAMHRPESPSYVSAQLVANAAAALEREDKRHAEALALLRAGTELFPTHAGLHARLGQAALQANDRTTALAAFRRALELDPLARLAAVRVGELAKEPKSNE